MATIQDIFDWLNQGAQGDIPGTDPSLPGSPSQTAQPQQQQQQQPPPPPAPPPDGSQGGEQQQAQKGAQAGQKAGQGLWAMLFGKQPQKTPGDYSGDIPATSLMHYQALISQGIPPAVAHSILTQPSVGEGESPSGQAWPQNYRGWWQDQNDEIANYGKVPLEQHMRDVRGTQEENLPTWEQNTPGDDDNLGFLRLPTGQYVPTSPSAQPSDLLSWYQSQGNPQSFWWNPAQGSGWDSLLGGQ